MWMLAVLQLALAGALGLVGEWGRRNARVLSGAGPGREHREAVLRRGALGCEAVAALFAIAVVADLA